MDKITLSADALLKFAILEASHREMSARHELLEESGGYEPSDDFLHKIDLLAKKEKRNKRFISFQKHLKKVAVFIVTALALSACFFIPVQAVQQAVISTVIEWKDDFAKFIYSTNSTALVNLPSDINVGYWPKGYTVQASESSYTANMFFQKALNNEEDFSFVFVQVVENEQWGSIDNENSEIFQLVLDDKTVLCSMNRDGTTILRWTEGSLLFEVLTSENLQEAIKIAQSISY